MAREPARRRRTVPNYARSTIMRVFIVGCYAPLYSELMASILPSGPRRRNENRIEAPQVLGTNCLNPLDYSVSKEVKIENRLILQSSQNSES
jgi:hypothetical protein